MRCKIFYDNSSEIAPEGKMTFFDDFYIDYKVQEISKSSKIYTAFLHPKKDIVLNRLEFFIPFEFNNQDQIFCHGYQSWSESYLLNMDQKIPKLKGLAHPYFKYYGDAQFEETKAEDLYSWTYGYVKNNKGITLVGSLEEKSSLTFIAYDVLKKGIRVSALCDGITLTHSFPVAQLFISTGKESEVFQEYFDKIEKARSLKKRSLGWCSWYKHFNKIDPALIREELDNYKKSIRKIKKSKAEIYFQIDDGFQSETGDWLKPKEAFKGQMLKLSNEIRKSGLIAGIWIAPFVCSKNSSIFKNHRDWLLKDEKGNPIKVGYNPYWGGSYFALDVYQKGVRDYLTEVFYTFQNKWHFDLIKIDFLFAASIKIRKDKNRAQQMAFAMNFIHELTKGKKILACGVPLGASFGKVDYCRISADVHTKWEHRLLNFANKRERVSTIAAINSILSRWHLNNQVFVSDPDVFLLRKEKNDLDLNQQYTLLVVNMLLGSQHFTSDDLSKYDKEQFAELNGLLEYSEAKILSVDKLAEDFWRINFATAKHEHKALINLSGKKMTLELLKMEGHLEPYESVIL